MLYSKFLIVKQAKEGCKFRVAGTVLHIVPAVSSRVSYQPVEISQLFVSSFYRGLSTGSLGHGLCHPFSHGGGSSALFASYLTCPCSILCPDFPQRSILCSHCPEPQPSSPSWRSTGSCRGTWCGQMRWCARERPRSVPTSSDPTWAFICALAPTG